MNRLELEALINERKTIILVGAGGVGKTSCSLGVAIFAARHGKKVGLLSIDPAKRLAKALGLPLGSQLKPIVFDEARNMKGSLEAAMLDQKAVFDSMVNKYSSDRETAKKILEHPLYISASTKLAGSSEYMALAKLQEMINSNKFELIILDTPPDAHALDFLNSPNILEGFKENKVMNWLIKPFNVARKMGAQKIISVSERLMGGLSKVTGLQALGTVADFFVLMQHVIEGFNKSGETLLRTLRDKETGFLLVTSCQNGSLRSAENLASQLSKFDYVLDGVIFNKCLPSFIDDSVTKNLKDIHNHQHHQEEIVELVHKLYINQKKSIHKFVNKITKDCPSNLKILRINERVKNLHRPEEIFDFSLAFDSEM